MKKITEDLVDSITAELWREGVAKYGTKFAVPKNVASYYGEVIRALYVLMYWQKNGSLGSPMAEMRGHSIMPEVAGEVVAKYCGEKYIKQEAEKEKTEKRKDKWSAFIAWANENQSKKFTTEQLAKKSGFSYQTTLTYVKTSPVFEKIKKGTYRVIPLNDRERKS
jgi:hypothetical protein